MKITLKEFDLYDIIQFLPATRDIKLEYQKCDGFCLPSIYEGYPNAICEAMCCAKPILCSNVCDNPTIVKEGVNGLMFNPYDFMDMANTIIKFCNMSCVERIELGRKGREMAESTFSESVFVNNYLSLIYG